MKLLLVVQIVEEPRLCMSSTLRQGGLKLRLEVDEMIALFALPQRQCGPVVDQRKHGSSLLVRLLSRPEHC